MEISVHQCPPEIRERGLRSTLKENYEQEKYRYRHVSKLLFLHKIEEEKKGLLK